MKVSEFISILQKFEDQDAEVFVVDHHQSTHYFYSGGSITEAMFDPKVHMNYVDYRGDPFIKDSDEFFDRTTLLIGATYQ